MASLQESERKSFDSSDFCSSYKIDGKPVDVRLQMDAWEFFNAFFDKLEQNLKGDEQDLPPNLFIHLKRFEFDLENFVIKKLNSKCSFPMYKHGTIHKRGTT